MGEYKIVFAPTAAEDLNHTLQWLDENAPDKTQEWYEALKRDINSLSDFPKRCPLAPENGLWGNEEIRQLTFQRYLSTYRILFVIHQSTVRILNIRHGAKRYLHEE